MGVKGRVRRVIAAVAAALLLGAGACGEEDVERSVNDGARQAEQAGQSVKEAGEDAAREAEKGAERAERELEK